MILKELYSYREMIISLVRRDLKGRYKNSVLGFLWTFLNPLLQLLVYTFVFSIVIPQGIENYYLHLFVAIVPWIFFSTCIVGGSRCIVDQQEMVKKIYFPREVLPISFVTGQFVNMLLSFIVIFIVITISGIGVNLDAIIYLPLIFVLEYMLALGITFISSAITVYLRDMEQILGVVAMAWMYASPVIYSADAVPEELRGIFNMNPITPIIIAYRDILYYKRIPQVSTLLGAFLSGVIVIIIGVILFSIMKRRFVEEL